MTGGLRYDVEQSVRVLCASHRSIERGAHMAARVLSTDQAKTAIQQVQQIINGGLAEQITKLDAQGKTLSNPDVWDGPLAQQFRDQTWPETKSALDKAQQELDQLRDQLQKIAQNIMTAGGGG